jgi:exosortase
MQIRMSDASSNRTDVPSSNRENAASSSALRLTPIIVLAVAFGVLYRGVLVKLVHDWGHDENYSHGFLIVPVALYFVYERWARLRAAALRPSLLGLIVVLGGFLVLIAGVLGAELFLTRISMLVVIAGAILFALGWAHLRILTFPLAFLLLMIPLPAIIFNQIAFPLQLLASRFGEATLNLASIPVLREGNVIMLANTTLEVAEACSGIRSLVSLLTLGIVLGYFMDSRTWMRWVIALATIPIAIVTNGLRVAGTGIAAHYIGPEAATGFFHEFSGWLVFVAAFALLFLLMRALLLWRPPVSPEPRGATAA